MQAMPRWLLRVLQALGIAWASPCTALGIAAGAVCMVAGAHAHFNPRAFAIVFHGVPWGPGGALTLGNVILHTGQTLESPCVTYAHRAKWRVDPDIMIGTHERAHVFQYMVLGPLFLPVYFLFGGVHVRNRFERAADRYALTGRGWWPWPKP